MKKHKLLILVLFTLLVFIFSFIILSIFDFEYNKLPFSDNDNTNSVEQSDVVDVKEEENIVDDVNKDEPSKNTNEPVEKIKALNFTFTTYDGREVSLSDYEGSYVVLNFFTTWCEPCLSEMPTFADSQEKFRDKNIVFLMVNVQYDSGDTMEDLNKFVESNDYNFDNILIDTDANYFNSNQLTSFPTTFFIDTNGYIQGTFMYPLNDDILEKMIDILIENNN